MVNRNLLLFEEDSFDVFCLLQPYSTTQYLGEEISDNVGCAEACTKLLAKVKKEMVSIFTDCESIDAVTDAMIRCLSKLNIFEEFILRFTRGSNNPEWYGVLGIYYECRGKLLLCAIDRCRMQ